MGEIRIAVVVAVVTLGLAAVGTVGAVDGSVAIGVDAADASLGAVQTNITDGTNTTNTTDTTDANATGTVAGTVTDGGGSAVADATVTVGSATTATDATGGYAVTVPTGVYTLTVSVAGEQVATQSVNVTANETTVADVSVAVTTTISGTVTDSDGQPVSSVIVDLRQPGGFEDTAGFPDEYVARTQPAANGSYQLSVGPGDYDIGAGSVEYGLEVANVSLSPGETLTRNFTLDRADGGITGTVTGESGAPVQNATVTTLNDTASATSNADGGFTLTLAEGTYSVVVDADGYQPTTSDVSVQAGQTTAIDFSLTTRDATSPLDVAISGTSSPVAPGDTLAVDAALTNRRDVTVSQTVSLVVDGTTVDDTFVSVAAGASRSVTLVWTSSSDASGSYTAVVRSGDAAASTAIAVDPSLNDSNGSGTDGGDTGDGTGENETGDSDPLFGTGDDSTDSGPMFGTDNTSSGDLFGGIGNDTSQPFGGFNTSSPGGTTFEFGTETGGTDFEFKTGSDAPAFEFGTETGGTDFEFGTDSDTPTFDFSPD